MTTTAKHSPLVTVRQLKQRLAEPNPPVLVDVRWIVGSPALRQDYLAAHIPGAHWCDLDADLADPPGSGGRHPLPDAARLQQRMRSWGINADSQVVVYDGAQSVAAARGWWVLRWAGLDDVRVLDGGFAAWVAADEQTESGAVPDAAGRVTVRAGSLPTLDAEAAAASAAHGRLIDVRAPERFRGEVEPIDPVAGHIPGAVNIPTVANVGSDGAFKSPEVLRARFADVVTVHDGAAPGAGVQDGAGAGGDSDAAATAGLDPAGVYCGSGVTAAQTVLAMAVAGIPAALYPGSWSEWIVDPDRPVATG